MTSHLRLRIAHAAVIVVGLLVLAYPFTLGANPSLTCRGVPLQPGDVCVKADGSGVQTYEVRANAVRNARPVMVGVGVLVAGFGVVLLVSELKRRRSPSKSAAATH